MDDPLDIIVDELGHPTGVAARIGGIEIGDGARVLSSLTAFPTF
jgi:hypothetical protein